MIEIGVNNMKCRGGLPAVIAKIAVKVFAERLRYLSLYASDSFHGCVLRPVS